MSRINGKKDTHTVSCTVFCAVSRFSTERKRESKSREEVAAMLSTKSIADLAQVLYSVLYKIKKNIGIPCYTVLYRDTRTYMRVYSIRTTTLAVLHEAMFPLL